MFDYPEINNKNAEEIKKILEKQVSLPAQAKHASSFNNDMKCLS